MSLEHAIQQHGKPYHAALLPKDLHRMPLGKCFDNCIVQAIMNPKYKYVEGVAFTPFGERKWILHAWLTDGTHAYDPTWKALDKDGKEVVMPTVYIGVELDAKAVGDFMIDTEYAGLLANAWRNPKLAAKALGNNKHLIYGKTGKPLRK